MATHLHQHPRLVLALIVGLLAWWALPARVATHAATRALVGWNLGTTLYVLLTATMMWRSTHALMRRRALQHDEGAVAVLVLAVLATVGSLAAIAAELVVARDLHGSERIAHVGLAVFTVAASWAFVQTMFALHYAHEYYAGLARGEGAGLDFPGRDARPGYGDFFYVSAVIGTSGQTADVGFAGKGLRRIGTMHCILAYLFNTTVLALLINIAAGLL